MDQARVLSMPERFKLALEKFWRAHIVDDDPYDALENEQFETLIRTHEAAKKNASASKELSLAA